MTTTMGALSRRVVANSPRNDSNSNDNNEEKTLATTTGNVDDDSKYHHKKRGPWRRILATMIVLLPLALILPVTIDFDESIGYNKDSAQHMMTKHTFSYLDPWTNESVTRTVLVDPPARFHRRPLNYYNDGSDSHHELIKHMSCRHRAWSTLPCNATPGRHDQRTWPRWRAGPR